MHRSAVDPLCSVRVTRGIPHAIFKIHTFISDKHNIASRWEQSENYEPRREKLFAIATKHDTLVLAPKIAGPCEEAANLASTLLSPCITEVTYCTNRGRGENNERLSCRGLR